MNNEEGKFRQAQVVTNEGKATETRRFEFVGGDVQRKSGNAAKFWEVSQSGADVTVSYGRIGTAGQTKVKTLASEEAATKEVEKLIGEKTKKGYVEVQ